MKEDIWEYLEKESNFLLKKLSKLLNSKNLNSKQKEIIERTMCWVEISNGVFCILRNRGYIGKSTS